MRKRYYTKLLKTSLNLDFLEFQEERLSQMKATLRKIDKMDAEQQTLIGELETDEEEEVETRSMSTQTDEIGMADAQTQTEG